jgi:hypothetical protein
VIAILVPDYVVSEFFRDALLLMPNLEDVEALWRMVDYRLFSPESARTVWTLHSLTESQRLQEWPHPHSPFSTPCPDSGR